MKRNMLKGKVWFLVLGLILSGCAKEEIDNSNVVKNGMRKILLRPDFAERVIVRSPSNEVKENEIQNVWVIQLDKDGNVVVNEGKKLIEQYNNDRINSAEDGLGGSITMKVDPTTTEICFIANTSSSFTQVASKSDIEKVSQSISNEESLIHNNEYLPMVGTWIPQAGSSNEVKLLRTIAKLDLSLAFDPETPDDCFALSSIQIKQVANILQYYRNPETIETGVYPILEKTVDYTIKSYDTPDNSDDLSDWGEYMPTGSDVCRGKIFQAKETEEKFMWYLPENARGIGSATNQWEKNAQTAPSEQAEYCTYEEIKGYYSTNGLVEEVVYHVYLGKNNYNDFNLLRNRNYIMTATIRNKKLVDTRISEHTPQNYYDYTDNNSAWILVGKGHENQKNWNKADLQCPEGWKVPTKDELMLTWVYLSKSQDLGAAHWSIDGDEINNETKGRWSVNLGIGETLYVTKGDSRFLRCVKDWTPDDGQKYPYVKNGNIIVSREDDRGVNEAYLRTEGDWSDGTPPHEEKDSDNAVFEKLEIASKATEVSYQKRLTWEEAAEYCKNLNEDGGGWRMPTQRELMLMYLLNKELDSEHQLLSTTDDHVNEDPNSDEYHVFYWSATQDGTVENSTNTAWSVCFCTDNKNLSGKTEGYEKTKVNYVRCVRDVKVLQ